MNCRSEISKYLVQWDKEETFGRSYAGGDVSHSDASEWSSVVTGTHHQVRTESEYIMVDITTMPPVHRTTRTKYY